jgi:hypothetical protein
VAALRAVIGRVDTDLVIFTEDRFSMAWVNEILRLHFRNEFDRIEVHAVAGAGNAEKIHKLRKSDPSISSRSICVLDGDSLEEAEESQGIFKLPGRQPELTIFDGVVQNASEKSGCLDNRATPISQRAKQSPRCPRQSIPSQSRSPSTL